MPRGTSDSRSSRRFTQELTRGGDVDAMRYTQLRIRWATNVPRVDTFSESDPYIRVIVPGQTDATQTKAIQDEPNPWWDEDFYFDCIGVDGRLEGEVKLELWDENEGRTADILIGSCVLDLAAYTPDEWPEIELQVVLEPKWQRVLDEARRPKKGWLGFGGKALTDVEKDAQEAKLRDPTVTVSVIGSVPSFQSLIHQVSSMDNVIIDKETSSLRVPLEDPKLESVSLFVGLGFSNTEGLKLIVSTACQDSPYFIDFNISPRLYGGQEGKPGDGSIKIERIKWPKGRKVAPRIKIYEEVRLKGLPLNVDLQEVTVLIAPKLPPEAQFSVSSLLEWGGFSGPGVAFNKALKQMTANGALSSSKRQEIYLPPDHEWPPTCLLGLDWKLAEDTPHGVCPGLVAFVVHSKGIQNLNWEFSFHSSSPAACEYSTECFSKPIKLKMGDEKLRCKKILTLADPGGRLRCDKAIGGLCLSGFGLDQRTRSYLFLKALLGQDSSIGNDEMSPRGPKGGQDGDRSSITRGIGKGLGMIGSGLNQGLSKAGSTLKTVFGGGLLARRKEEQGGDSIHSSKDSPTASAVTDKLMNVLSLGGVSGNRNKQNGKKYKEVVQEEEEGEEDY